MCITYLHLINHARCFANPGQSCFDNTHLRVNFLSSKCSSSIFEKIENCFMTKLKQIQ